MGNSHFELALGASLKTIRKLIFFLIGKQWYQTEVEVETFPV